MERQHPGVGSAGSAVRQVTSAALEEVRQIKAYLQDMMIRIGAIRQVLLMPPPADSVTLRAICKHTGSAHTRPVPEHSVCLHHAAAWSRHIGSNSR